MSARQGDEIADGRQHQDTPGMLTWYDWGATCRCGSRLVHATSLSKEWLALQSDAASSIRKSREEQTAELFRKYPPGTTVESCDRCLQ